MPSAIKALQWHIYLLSRSTSHCPFDWFDCIWIIYWLYYKNLYKTTKFHRFVGTLLPGFSSHLKKIDVPFQALTLKVSFLHNSNIRCLGSRPYSGLSFLLISQVDICVISKILCSLTILVQNQCSIKLCFYGSHNFAILRWQQLQQIIHTACYLWFRIQDCGITPREIVLQAVINKFL